MYNAVTGEKCGKNLEKKSGRKLIIYDGSENLLEQGLRLYPSKKNNKKTNNSKQTNRTKNTGHDFMGSYRPAESLRTVQCMELMTGRTENIAVVSEQKKHNVKEFHDILRGAGGLAIVRVNL